MTPARTVPVVSWMRPRSCIIAGLIASEGGRGLSGQGHRLGRQSGIEGHGEPLAATAPGCPDARVRARGRRARVAPARRGWGRTRTHAWKLWLASSGARAPPFAARPSQRVMSMWSAGSGSGSGACVLVVGGRGAVGVVGAPAGRAAGP
eukprot:2816819-Alexandrium_andersonii.AAC.1